MTTKQLKSEIQKVIDHVPEQVLQDILAYLKQLEASSPKQIQLSRNLKHILAEDRELLEKLAQ